MLMTWCFGLIQDVRAVEYLSNLLGIGNQSQEQRLRE